MTEVKDIAWNRKVILIAFLYLSVFCGAQPTTFNTHDHFGLAYIQPGGILPVDDGYVYVGQAIDTTKFLFHWIIGKSDLEGNPVCHAIHRVPYRGQQFTFSDVVEYAHGQYLTMGSDSASNILAVFFDDNCDTIRTRLFRPVLSGPDTISSIRITELKMSPDSGFVATTNASFFNSKQKGGVFKFSQDLDLEWYDFFGTNRRFGFAEIDFTDNGSILIFGYEDITGIRDDPDFISQITLFKYTMDGIRVDSKWSEPEHLRDVLYGATPVPDGSGYITSSFAGRPYLYQPHYGLWAVEWSNNIQKLDNQLNLVWETPIGRGWSRYQGYYIKQVMATDGSGVVAAGQSAIEKFDSAGYYQKGLITKVNWQGDSIWSRQFVADPTLYSDYGLFDIEATEDGGYVLAGMAVFYEGWPDLYNQHLWLVKTDEYGCVVPGCNLVSSVLAEEHKQSKMLVYPNPGGSVINIFVSTLNLSDKSHLVIADMNGQVVYNMRHHFKEVTYSIDISAWPTGSYACQIWDGPKLLSSELLIVAH